MANKIVEYSEYCNKCEHEKLAENEEPCWTCLDHPVNEDTHRPTEFKEKEE